MRVDVLTIFPGYLAPLELSLIGRARQDGLLDVRVHDLRDWTHDRHRTVDDTPYGGGPGMVMRPEPWGEALDEVLGSGGLPPSPPEPPPRSSAPQASQVDRSVSDAEAGTAPAAASDGPRLIVPTPSGRPFTQALAHELAAEPWLVFACGRYEGIDARVVEEASSVARVDEVSIGDYVLNGGEVAVLAMVEAVARLLPGVIGNAESLVEESHADGLLEYPVYTKPATWRGREVPDVLLSGHHGAIARWRRDQALRRTARLRPDLVRALPVSALDARDLAVLAEAGWSVDDGQLGIAAAAVAD